MAIYTKVDKEVSTYTKTDKSNEGWFERGWFSDWFSREIYRRVIKVLSNYTKINK